LAALVVSAAAIAYAQGGRARGNQQPGPTITVRGHTFTQLSLFQRNVGGPDDMTTPFPPHKVIGNIYYVGTKSLAEFLITTPQGHIRSSIRRDTSSKWTSTRRCSARFWPGSSD